MALDNHVLTIQEMYQADQMAMEAGISGEALMENAGQSVVDVILDIFPVMPVVILCGPGNNGGDGYVVARLLQDKDWPVLLASTVPIANLTGDAAIMAAKWAGPVASICDVELPEKGLVVDALFGAGLSRPIDGDAAVLLGTVADSGLPVLAIDVPSGLNGGTGLAGEYAVPADITVSFFRPKTGHLIEDGPELCGDLIITDIGIPDRVLDTIQPKHAENDPAAWFQCWPYNDRHVHKYEKGHAVVFAGGPWQGGAARLAARAALRAGAGLVTLVAKTEAMPIHAARLDAIMLHPCDGLDDLEALLEDRRFNAFVLGPGFGPGNSCREYARRLIETGRGLVLDADALTSFSGNVDAFAQWMNLHGDPHKVVLTPHEGEFARLFRDLAGDRLARARAAASLIGGVIVLKGPDTLIAAPDGRVLINGHASPDLATAGSGDVLAGIIAGFLAQGMPAFEAAAAAVWCHGDAGLRFGRGLIAEDLPELLPDILQNLAAFDGEFADESAS